MPEVTIKPATKRDTSWIAANMREIDKREIYPLMHEDSSLQLAWLQLQLSKRFAVNAFINDEPVCAFGIAEYRPGIGELWAFGTSKIYGAMRAMTDHIRHEMAAKVFADESVWRLECRSSVEHKQAHAWIESIGLEYRCPLDNLGKNGEDYLLFDTSRKVIGDRTYEQYLKDMKHVRIKPTSNT